MLHDGPEPLLRLSELLLRQATLRDVEHHPLTQPWDAVLVADHDGLVVHPDDAPVRPPEAVLSLVRRAVAVQALDLRGDLRQVFGLHALLPEVGASQPLFRRIAEDVHDLRAHVDGLRYRFDGVDVRRGRDRLDQRAVALFRLMQLLLAELALRDVHDDALAPERLPVVVVDHDRFVADPVERAVLGDHPELHGERLTALVVDAVRLDRGGAVVRVDDVLPQRVVAAPLLRCVPEDVLDLRADVDRVPGADVVRAPALVDVRDGRDLLDERPVTLLRVPEVHLGFLPRRDVEPDTLPIQRIAPVVPQEHGVVLEPDDPVVGTHHPVFAAERLARLLRPEVLGEDAFAIVGMDGSLPALVAPIGRVEPEDRLHLGTDVELPARLGRRFHIGDGGDLLDERLVPRLRLGERAHRALAPDRRPQGVRDERERLDLGRLPVALILALVVSDEAPPLTGREDRNGEDGHDALTLEPVALRVRELPDGSGDEIAGGEHLLPTGEAALGVRRGPT